MFMSNRKRKRDDSDVGADQLAEECTPPMAITVINQTGVVLQAGGGHMLSDMVAPADPADQTIVERLMKSVKSSAPEGLPPVYSVPPGLGLVGALSGAVATLVAPVVVREVEKIINQFAQHPSEQQLQQLQQLQQQDMYEPHLLQQVRHR